ncbi:MAG: histidine phosphatase family protein [Arenimonas sp.]
MKIILARHGETPWNAAGRYQGQIDIPLSETGEAQAAKLGERLRDVPITRAVSSQLARARATAEAALGENRKAILQIDQRLQEIAHGDWEGLLAQEISECDPLTFQAWRDAPQTVQMPNGENLKQVLDRSWEGFAAACAELGAEDTLLVVAHDAVNRVLLCRILGLGLDRLWSFRQAPTTINLLEGETVDNLAVVRLNDCQHHTPLFGEALHRAL